MNSLEAGRPGSIMNRVEKTARAVDRVQQRRPWLAFPVAVWKKFSDDRAGNLAALISYYGFAAVFPLLLVLVTVLDITLRNYPRLRNSLEHSTLAQYPVIGDEILKNVTPRSGQGWPLALGLILTFLGARAVANAMQNALNSVWSVPLSDRPGFPWNWLRSYGLIFVIGGGLVITSAISGLAGGAAHLLPGAAASVLAVAVSLILNVGVFLLAFRLATANCIPWRDLRVGAALAAAVWQILLSVGGYFVTHQLNKASSTYGTFAVVLGLMTWLYLEAEVTLYAAEVNVVLVRRLWPRAVVTPPYTEADRQAHLMYAQATQRDRAETIELRAPEAESADGPRGSHEEKVVKES
jgi:YihY family inner membrane protein